MGASDDERDDEEVPEAKLRRSGKHRRRRRGRQAPQQIRQRHGVDDPAHGMRLEAPVPPDDNIPDRRAVA